MNTHLPLPRLIRGQHVFKENLTLLFFAVLLCIGNNLFAGGSPSLNNKNRPGNKARNLPAVPTLSYTSPQTYSVGFPIAPLAPTSTGVASPGYGSPVPIASGLTLPSDLVVDAAGNVYVVDAGNLKKIPAKGGAPVTIAVAKDVAIDAAGNLYVIDGQKIKKIPAGGGATVSLSPTFARPSALAVDAAGNVYVSDPGGSTVQKIPVGGGGPITIGDQFFVDPIDIAVDAAGNAYVAEFNFAYIVKVSASDNSEVIAASGFRPYAVALDATGNIYLADADHASVSKVTTFQGPAIPFANIGACHGITVDASGVVYVSDQQTKKVYKITPNGGYYLSKPIPVGLSFSTSTGIVSGTPTALSPATDYTVTAYNNSGSKSTILSIATSIPPPPILSYSTPKTYFSEMAISPLAPASANIAAFSYNDNAANVATGLNAKGMAADASGNIYVADLISKSVKKIPAASGPPVTIGPKFNDIKDVAVDKTGNIYVADGHQVSKIPAGGGSPVMLSSAFFSITAIAVDDKGNLYIGDQEDSETGAEIKELPAGSNTPFSIGSDAFVSDIVTDDQNNVYYSGANGVMKIPPNGYGGTVYIFDSPKYLAMDAVGNLYYSSGEYKPDILVPTTGGNRVNIGPGFANPLPIVVDPAHNVYRFDDKANTIKKIRPVGGYFISRSLSKGLSFSYTTGVISGTPTITSPATNYVITAYNFGGNKSASVNITVKLPPLPSLSYSSPHTYNTNSAITPLVPTSSSVGLPGYAPDPVILSSQFTSPDKITVDGVGNLYITDNGAVQKIPVGSSDPVNLASNFNLPTGIAVDPAGNVYIADRGSKAVKKIPVNGGSPRTLHQYTGNLTPYSVAADSLGNLFVATYNDGDSTFTGGLDRISVNGGNPVHISLSFTVSDANVAADDAGNIYVVSRDGIIKKLPVSGGPVITFNSGLTFPSCLAADAAGNIYISDYNTLEKIPAKGGPPIVLGTDFVGLSGITTDLAGNIYISDTNEGIIRKIKPIGGYYLSRVLPNGLTFSDTTGTISGTPTKASPTKPYVITAYNAAGSVSSMVTITVNSVLNISYVTPQSYLTGTAITPLSPTSSSVAAVGYSNSPVNLGSGFNAPTGTATDAAGNIYVADQGNNKVKKIPAGGGSPVSIGSGFNQPSSVAVDAAGNVYVADFGSGSIKKIPAGGGNTTTFHQYLADIVPTSITIDFSGKFLYVTNQDDFDGGVDKFSINGGDPVPIGSNFLSPGSIAVDGIGNIFVTDRDTNNSPIVKKIPGNGGPIVRIGSAIANPRCVTVDASGNIYIVDNGAIIKKISSTGGAPFTISSVLNAASSIMVDGAGNIYATDNNDVKKIKPIGGYYLNRPLPQGINFSNSTGTFSGTPVVPIPATNYTVTAYNGGGSKAATVNITVKLPPVPIISYSTPHTYVTNTVITPLVPANTGVAAPAYSTAPVNVGSGFNFPVDVAVDTAGNVYVADEDNNNVKKIPVGGGSPIILGSGFKFPTGIAVDLAGNVYVADNNNNKVKKIPVGGGSPVTLGSGFSFPTDVAVDKAGNVYVNDNGNGKVKKIPAAGGAPVTLASGLLNLNDIAVDDAGNVYVADENDNTIKKIPAAGGSPVIIASGLNFPVGVAVDALGNVYAGVNGGGIKKIPVGGGAPVGIGGFFNTPSGVAIDARGNIYAANPTSSSVIKFTPLGGYYLSRPLPAGLTFSTSTGAITGTPTSPAPATNYIITAYNTGGGGSTAVNITVLSSNANLASLKLSTGTLSPAFSTSIISYAASVSNSTASIQVTPTSSSLFATIKVNGVAVTSGTASQSIPLSVGSNNINTVVTAQNGAIKTYSVNVTRAASSVAPADNVLATTDATTDNDIVVHQAVSPNGDGANDVLVIDKINSYPDNRLMIINASGVKVFDIRGYDNASRVFDGHSNITGAMQQPGTYFYSVDYTTNGTHKHKTGYIIIKY